jgi:hypothetical protein
MNSRISYILEIFWLVVAILGLVAGMHQTYREGLQKSWLFFLIACIGFSMFFLRRTMRKKTGK